MLFRSSLDYEDVILNPRLPTSAGAQPSSTGHRRVSARNCSNACIFSANAAPALLLARRSPPWRASVISSFRACPPHHPVNTKIKDATKRDICMWRRHPLATYCSPPISYNLPHFGVAATGVNAKKGFIHAISSVLACRHRDASGRALLCVRSA